MNEAEQAVETLKSQISEGKEISKELRESILSLQLFMRVDDENKSKLLHLSQYISAETTSINEHEGVRFREGENGRYYLQYYSKTYGWKDVKLYVP